jgi:hypothetical protein
MKRKGFLIVVGLILLAGRSLTGPSSQNLNEELTAMGSFRFDRGVSLLRPRSGPVYGRDDRPGQRQDDPDRDDDQNDEGVPVA